MTDMRRPHDSAVSPPPSPQCHPLPGDGGGGALCGTHCWGDRPALSTDSSARRWILPDWPKVNAPLTEILMDPTPVPVIRGPCLLAVDPSDLPASRVGRDRDVDASHCSLFTSARHLPLLTLRVG